MHYLISILSLFAANSWAYSADEWTGIPILSCKSIKATSLYKQGQQFIIIQGDESGAIIEIPHAQSSEYYYLTSFHVGHRSADTVYYGRNDASDHVFDVNIETRGYKKGKGSGYIALFNDIDGGWSFIVDCSAISKGKPFTYKRRR